MSGQQSMGSGTQTHTEMIRQRRLKKFDPRPEDQVDGDPVHPESMETSDEQGSGDAQTRSQNLEIDGGDRNTFGQYSASPSNNRPNTRHQIAPSGSSHPSASGQPRRKLETYAEWQFYLDYLASKVSGEINQIAVFLSIDSSKREEIKNLYKRNHREYCFRILWTWYNKVPNNEKRTEQICEALHESGRADLKSEFQEGKAPIPSDFTYTEDIQNPNLSLSDIEVVKVSKQLSLTFSSLARYFGVDENSIQTICVDNCDNVMEQAYATVKMCIRQLKLSTRRQLCDGLTYLELNSVIEELKQSWS